MIKKILLMAFIAITLSGCSSKETREEITFSSWGSITEVQVLNQILSDFEKKNPDIKVNFIHIPQNYFQKIHLLFASNTAPDVIFINNLYLPIYAPFLADLTDVIKKNDYYEQAITGLSFDNKILAMPRDISNLILYINADIIPEFPSKLTMDDFLKILRQSQKEGIFAIGAEDEIYWATPYLAYYGETLTDSFKPASSQGLKTYKELKYSLKLAPTKSQVGSSTLAQMFLDKKNAIYLSGRWMYPKISEKANFAWYIAEFPQGLAKQPCDVSGWAISKQSKHKESALKLVNFLSNETSSEYFTSTGLIVPARVDVAQKLNNDIHNEKIFLKAISNSKSIPITSNYKKMTDEINNKYLK